MKSARFHPLSLLAGCGLALIAFVGLGLRPAAAKPDWEYDIADDIDQGDANKLAKESWEYVGYLGRGIKSADNDQTLWRRPLE
jgi:hypothetical protein